MWVWIGVLLPWLGLCPSTGPSLLCFLLMVCAWGRGLWLDCSREGWVSSLMWGLAAWRPVARPTLLRHALTVGMRASSRDLSASPLWPAGLTVAVGTMSRTHGPVKTGSAALKVETERSQPVPSRCTCRRPAGPPSASPWNCLGLLSCSGGDPALPWVERVPCGTARCAAQPLLPPRR